MTDLRHNTGSSLLDHIAAEHDRIHEAWFPPPPKKSIQPPQKTVKPPQKTVEPITGSSLDPRMTFTSFHVGDSNRVAYVEANRAACAIKPIYNPLYLHASVGLGKTHLLQAVAQAAAANRQVLYLTADRFMYGFVSALKAQTACAFKERLRAVDVLVIDDIQFLQGKSIQQEFCYALNAFFDDIQKQIIVAADCPPRDLESLEERTRSRFAGGLCIEIGPLDADLRVKILEARIAAVKLVHQTFEVPAEVIAYIASVIQTNGRDLVGAVNRLVACSSVKNSEHHHYQSPGHVTMELAESAICDLVCEPERKKVRIEAIQKMVASHFNVTRDDILSARRTACVVRPRQIAMYLSKQLTLRSLPDIARRFAGRDHTTVLHGVRKIEKLVAEDKALAEEIDVLSRMLLS